ncbi:hypothetical protein [Candidatus Liberibacter sp.]|uniref:hypothetical protein n=1 Tax=Candidatus Liberibacter sp. TaxID=34022 RepID=UPI001C715B80|nr:hypothetical protein [Candidatus Liberibacter sp.]
MLDFNETFSEKVTAYIDRGLQSQHREQRDYLGASLLGESCSRKLQYHLTQTPKDEEFSGRTLRIFELGHSCEKLGIKWC